MNFFGTLNTTIYNTLSGTALTSALGGTAIYYLQAPDDAAMPYVVWNWQSSVDDNMTPSRMKNSIVNVRSFASRPAQSGTIEAIIDGYLHGQTLSVSGWSNFWTAKELDFSDVITEPNGEKTYVSGGLYRIRIGQ
jgi:hypothetical protein